MISNKKDYIAYIKADLANADYKGDLKDRLFNSTWRFLRLLRLEEYYINCKQSKFDKIWCLFIKLRRKRIGERRSFTIPANVCGEGLSIPYAGAMIINDRIPMDDNCRIHVCVNIGADKVISEVSVLCISKRSVDKDLDDE